MTLTEQPRWSDPITDLDAFHDREARLERPFRDLPRPESRLHAVLGGAKMGKTSLLNVLPTWLLQEPVRHGQRLAPTPIHYRREDGDLDSPQAFLLRLVKEFREGLRNLGLCTIAERNFEPYFADRPPTEGFRDALNFLLEQVRRASSAEGRPLGEVRLIGLVDNAEEVARLPWASDLFCDLRSLYACEELVRRRTDLVLAGEERLARYFDSGAPWADGGRLFLHPMAPGTVQAWLQDASQGQLPPTLAQAIVAESGGQPFLVRYFLHEIRRQAERRGGWGRLPPDIIARLAARFVQRQHRLLGVWALSLQWADPHGTTWAAYRLLAEAGDTGLDANDTEDLLWDQGLQADAEQVLERLMWQGVVRPLTGEPRRFVTAGLFRRYAQFQEGSAAPEPPPEPDWKAVLTSRRPRRPPTMPDYDDFSLRLSVQEDGYRVRVESRWGEPGGLFHNPLSRDEQAAMWQYVARPGSTAGLPESIGGRLFRALFQGEILVCFRRAWEEARRERLGLRLELILEPPELHGLPWEFLHDQEYLGFLALSNKTPLVRYVERPTPVPSFKPVEQLRLLVILASPLDQRPLNLARELHNIRMALEPRREQGWLEYDVVQGQEANSRYLQQVVRRQEYHVLHFVGHSAFDAASGQGLLLLEGPNRRSDPLTARQLAQLLRDETAIRLVFLNACETARAPERSPFASVAGTLVQAGVPAVVATQYAISDGAASSLAREFYQALAELYPVEAAVAEGRKAIDLAEKNAEWGVPVLYLRAQDGYLFH